MKKQLLGASIAALVVSTPALAQRSVLSPVSAFNWTGFYVGANFGFSSGPGNFSYSEPAFGAFGLPSLTTLDQKLSGPIGGLQSGYNTQIGLFVFGLETDFDWTGQQSSRSFAYNYPGGFEGATTTLTGAVTAKLAWLGTMRGRFGWLVTPTIWAYATAGLAYGRVNVSGAFSNTACIPTCTWSFSSSQTKTGYVVGAGVEGAIANLPTWTWRVEYLHVDLGTVTGVGFDPSFIGSYYWSQRVTDNVVRVGLNMKVP